MSCVPANDRAISKAAPRSRQRPVPFRGSDGSRLRSMRSERCPAKSRVTLLNDLLATLKSRLISSWVLRHKRKRTPHYDIHPDADDQAGENPRQRCLSCRQSATCGGAEQAAADENACHTAIALVPIATELRGSSLRRPQAQRRSRRGSPKRRLRCRARRSRHQFRLGQPFLAAQHGLPIDRWQQPFLQEPGETAGLRAVDKP